MEGYNHQTKAMIRSDPAIWTYRPINVEMPRRRGNSRQTGVPDRALPGERLHLEGNCAGDGVIAPPSKSIGQT